MFFRNSFSELWNFFVCYDSKPGSHFARNLREFQRVWCRLEVKSTGSSLSSQSERAKNAIHCFSIPKYVQYWLKRVTKEPHLTVTSFTRPPCYYTHFVFSWEKKILFMQPRRYSSWISHIYSTILRCNWQTWNPKLLQLHPRDTALTKCAFQRIDS